MIKNINGHELYFEDHGNPTDPVVVLLHHGLGSTYSWKQQIHPLVEAGFRVIVYDRWGYGHSSARQHLDLPQFVDDQADLLGLLDVLGLERVALVGHSDGGTIALYLAAAHPERVSALVAIAAHIYIEEKMQASLYAIWKVFADDSNLRAGLQHLHGEKTDQIFDNWFNGWVQVKNLEWDLRPQLASIGCPALIVQGTEDEHATPSHAEELAAGIPGAELLLVPGGMHMLPQDDPGHFNARLIEFLKKHIFKAGS